MTGLGALGLTNAQISALTLTQINSITNQSAAQVQAFVLGGSADQQAALLANPNLSSTQAAYISSIILSQIPSCPMKYLSITQITNLTTAQLASYFTSQPTAAAVFNTLSNDQQIALYNNQNLTPSLGAWLPPLSLGNI